MAAALSWDRSCACFFIVEGGDRPPRYAFGWCHLPASGWVASSSVTRVYILCNMVLGNAGWLCGQALVLLGPNWAANPQWQQALPLG